MGKLITKKIESVKLIKIEKTYNAGSKPTYYYSIQLEEIEDPIIIELKTTLTQDMVGMKLKYRVNTKGEIIDFDVV